MEDNEDLNRIEILGTETISEQDFSLENRRFLTSRETNDRTCVRPYPNDVEIIELSAKKFPTKIKSKSSFLDVANLGVSRVQTPTNSLRRWSQNLLRFKNDRDLRREKRIYRLPSRQIFEIDENLISVNPQLEFDQLVKEIEQHAYLMQDRALSKQSRLETLKALPQPLSIKRLLKERLAITIEEHQAQDPKMATKKFFDHIIDFILVGTLKFWLLSRMICRSVKIWNQALKKIEGHFGSNVSSYFKFLRFLFACNVLLLVGPLSFVTIPQILYNNKFDWPISNTSHVDHDGSWSLLNLLSGEGFLKTSLMFYDGYSNATGNGKSYSIPHAYFLTMLFLYLTTFVIFSTRMARSYRKSFIRTSGGAPGLYANKIFGAWDYGVSDRKASELKHLAIRTEFKEILNEMDKQNIKPSIWNRIVMFLSQFITHLIIFILIASIGVAMWSVLNNFGIRWISLTSWSKFCFAFIINISILLFQTLFSWISKLENYRTPRRVLYMTMVRNFLLELVVIAVLMHFWLSKKHNEGWETRIGQEIYRLIITDFVLSSILLPVFHCLRVFIFNHFWPKCKRPEFDISKKSLSLVFIQTLLWIGLFFAPLLAGVMIFKMILQFYIDRAVLKYLCKSPQHLWRSAQTQTFYLVFAFLSLIGVIVGLGYIMTQLPISKHSGPFHKHDYMFQILIDGVLKLRQNRTIWSLLMQLIRPAVVGGFLIILSIMVYYLRAKARAHCMMVKVLKEMLSMETQDKNFLLNSIANVAKDRQVSFQKTQADISARLVDELQTEASGTWRYARKRIASNHSSFSISLE